MADSNALFLLSHVRMMAFRFLEAELQAAELADLPVSYGDVLFAAARTQPIEILEIARQVRKDKSTVSNVLKDLTRRGYVTRTRDPDDRRRVLVQLTARARAALPTFLKISRKMNRRLFRGFSPAEQAELRGYLERLAQNLS
jgi:DNA-binding MarR family transcriptional regulator